MTGCSTAELKGSLPLLNWLEKQGFLCAVNPNSTPLNQCNWYAYRRSAVPARECAAHPGKAIQLVIRPSEGLVNGTLHTSCEVELAGELNQIWFKLSACPLSGVELKDRLAQIEENLVNAWNAMQ